MRIRNSDNNILLKLFSLTSAIFFIGWIILGVVGSDYVERMFSHGWADGLSVFAFLYFITFIILMMVAAFIIKLAGIYNKYLMPFFNTEFLRELTPKNIIGSSISILVILGLLLNAFQGLLFVAEHSLFFACLAIFIGVWALLSPSR